MEKLKQFLCENDYFAKHNGIELLEVAPGYAKAQLVVQDYHRNGAKIVHGGAIFTLADFAFAAASNSRGRIAVGINATVVYMEAIRSGILIAEAKESSLNYKLGHYVVNIVNDENSLVATFQGTAYRKSVLLL